MHEHAGEAVLHRREPARDRVVGPQLARGARIGMKAQGADAGMAPVARATITTFIGWRMT